MLNGHSANNNGSVVTSSSVKACGTILTTVKWDVENDLYVSDFIRRYTLPHITLVTKGRHEHVGAPSVHCPHLKPYVYLHSKRSVKKLAGHIVKASKDGKSLQTVSNQFVSVSELFRGYFEILSEDGKSISPQNRYIESVLELNNKFPELILLRQQCKCYLPDVDGELRQLDKCRFLRTGEILTLVGRFHLKKTTFLRCFDESGSSVFLKMSQKIKCSPVAQGNELAGVHSAQSLMNKRLPLTVKLVQGPTTSDLSAYCATSNITTINGTNLIIRLRKTYREHVLFAYSLHKPEGQFLTIPLNVDLKFAPCSNQPQVTCHPEFKELCKLCDISMDSYKDKISLVHNYEVFYDKYNSSSSRSATKKEKERHTGGAAVDLLNQKKSINDHQPANDSISPRQSRDASRAVNRNTVAICDEEIDQLYDFIRGMVPTARHHLLSNNNHQSKLSTNPKSTNHRLITSSSITPPPPPPISTIPGRLLVRQDDESPPRCYVQSPPIDTKQHHHVTRMMTNHHHRLSVSLSPEPAYSYNVYDVNGTTATSRNEGGVARMMKTTNGVRDDFYGEDADLINGHFSPPVHHRLHYKNGDDRRRASTADPNIRSHTMFNMNCAQPVSPLHFNSQGHYYRKRITPNNFGTGGAHQSSSSGHRRRPLSVAIPDRVHLLPQQHQYQPHPVSRLSRLGEYDHYQQQLYPYHPHQHLSPTNNSNFYSHHQHALEISAISPRPLPLQNMLMPPPRHPNPNNVECLRRSMANLMTINNIVDNGHHFLENDGGHSTGSYHNLTTTATEYGGGGGNYKYPLSQHQHNNRYPPSFANPANEFAYSHYYNNPSAPAYPV